MAYRAVRSLRKASRQNGGAAAIALHPQCTHFSSLYLLLQVSTKTYSLRPDHRPTIAYLPAKINLFIFINNNCPSAISQNSQVKHQSCLCTFLEPALTLLLCLGLAPRWPLDTLPILLTQVPNKTMPRPKPN